MKSNKFLKKLKSGKSKLKKKSILFKIIMLLWSVIIITILLFVSFLIPYQKRVLVSTLESEAKAAAFSINQVTATAVISGDFSFVVDHCMNVVKESRQIKYIVITRKMDGFSLIHTEQKWIDKFLHGIWTPNIIQGSSIIHSEITGGDVFHYVSLFKYSGIEWGWIHIGLSLNKFKEDFTSLYVWTCVIAIICVIIGFVISYFFSIRLSRPIRQLHNITRKIIEGDLSVKASIFTGDEIEELAASFNIMTDTLKNSTAKLINANEYSSNILKSMYDALFVMSGKGIILTVNSSLNNLLGYEENELIGQPASKIISSNHYFSYQDMIRLNEKGKLTNVEKNYLRKDGSEIPMFFSATVMRDKNSDILGIVCAAHDITERKKMEKQLSENAAEIKRHADKITEAYNILQETQEHLIQTEKMASIGTLTAGIGHEINNPMAYIKWNLNSLKKYQLKINEFISFINEFNSEKIDRSIIIEEMKKLDIEFIADDLKIILRETSEGVEKIIGILQNLKTYSHPGDENKVACNIDKIIENIISIVKNEIKYNIKIVNEVNELPAIDGYPQQLGQVIMNLLVNAADSIRESGKITIKGYTENNEVIIKISDTGQGIPENIRHRIFDPFFTTKEVGKGTGLGLNIVYKIIKKHNGNIFLDSEKGEGSTFTIKLPIKDN